MPLSIFDWLPPGDFVWFIIDSVEKFDMTPFHRAFQFDGVGRAPLEDVNTYALLKK